MGADKRCWYCSRRDVELTDEHVLSQANFGGRLVTRRAVCQSCNGTVGKLERQMSRSAFLAEYIGRDRLLFSPPLPKPEAEGVTGGAEVRLRYGPAGATVSSRKPRLVECEDDGTEVWEVAAGEEERFRQRRRAQDLNLKVRVIGRAASDAPGLNAKFGIGAPNIDYWPRLGAKVALSLASLVLDDTWLDTPGAAGLQTVLARGAYSRAVFPNGLGLGPGELDPADEPGSVLRSGEHLLGLDRDDGGRAWMILFGGLYYFVPLLDADVPDWEPTWYLQPRTPPRGPLGAQGLLHELRARRDGTGR